MNDITNLGIPAIILILLLREIIPLLKDTVKKPNENGNGYLKWDEFETLASKVQYKDTCVEIVKRFDENYEAQEKRFDKIDHNIQEIKDLMMK